jgi:NAD+ synthase
MNKEINKEYILENLRVVPTENFDVSSAIRHRVNYLKNYLKENNLKAIVLGISGGVDSTTAGMLAQMAVSELRDEGYDSKFIAMRLPYNIQQDEDEAKMALDFINPDLIISTNIEVGVNGIFDSLNYGMLTAGLKSNYNVCSLDFAKGNIKARMRMISQYAVAGLHGGVVLGTDHEAENLLGFYTKGGDGFCDLIVLNGMNKRQVRLCAKALGAPDWLYSKIATADLEDDRPQISDEEAIGISYDMIDDFLEGKDIPSDIEDKIIHQFKITDHKRHLPVSFFKLIL